MKKLGYWVVRTYKAGRIGEKIKYWVPGEKPTRSARKMKSDIRKQKQNETDCIKRVARIINGNFIPGDCFNTLTVSDDGLRFLLQGLPGNFTEEEQRDYLMDACRKELRRFLKRCRESKSRLPWGKYFAIVSDMDGETGELVRIHCHIIAPAEANQMIREKWKLGDVREKKIWNEPDHYGLAKYLMDQVRRIPDVKKYISSRNLLIPQPTDRLALTDKEVQAPRGASMLYRSEFKTGVPQYIRYIIPEGKKHETKNDRKNERNSPQCQVGLPDEATGIPAPAGTEQAERSEKECESQGKGSMS